MSFTIQQHIQSMKIQSLTVCNVWPGAETGFLVEWVSILHIFKMFWKKTSKTEATINHVLRETPRAPVTDCQARSSVLCLTPPSHREDIQSREMHQQLCAHCTIWLFHRLILSVWTKRSISWCVEPVIITIKLAQCLGHYRLLSKKKFDWSLVA